MSESSSSHWPICGYLRWPDAESAFFPAGPAQDLRERLFTGRHGYVRASRTPPGGEMTITGVISAILIGIVVGVISAFIGTAIARALGIPTATEGIDWLELLVQVIVAAIGVALVSAMLGRRTGVMGRRRSGLMR